MNHLCEYLRDLIEKRTAVVAKLNAAMDAFVEPMRQIVETYDEQNELREKIDNLKNDIKKNYEKEESL